MLKDGQAVGVITVARRERRVFDNSDVALIETFAEQAVIALENVRLFTELEARNTELAESLERQMASSEILRVISNSHADAQPVFEAIIGNAVRLCGAAQGGIYRFDGTLVYSVAHEGFSAEQLEAWRKTWPRPLTAASLACEAIATRSVIRVDDVESDLWLARFTPETIANLRARRSRSLLHVPMFRGDDVIGVISLAHCEVNAFSAAHVEMLKTFADQAVIAIENVRLFNELERRNAQLTEALEQQTATSDILRVISSSPTDIQPVLDAVAKSAARLCEANDAIIFRVDGDDLEATTVYGPLGIHGDGTRRPINRGWVTGRAVVDRKTIHIHDLAAESDTEFPLGRALRSLGGHRTTLATPLLRENIPLGAILIRRKEVRPFTDKQIELLQTFADQAVIAIENVRLFNELQHRNSQLTEALDQQTATSEVLRVISNSPTDAQPVFDTIVRNAVHLCGASHGGVYKLEGDLVHSVAHEGYTPEELAAWRRTWPRSLGEASGSAACEAIRTRELVRVTDFENDPRRYQSSPSMLANLRARGTNSVLAAPMFRHTDVIGAISLTHRDVDGFTDAHVELLKTFADQAAIAIANARLFEEIQEKSRQLEGANRHKDEFLASMSHELRTPLNAVIGFSEVLLERMFGDVNEKQEEYLNDILVSGRHLLSLINDILDLTKIEAGRMELDLEDFDVSVAIDNALVLVRERATRKELSLDWTTGAKLGTLRGDQRKFKQILLNLLSNALKFTPEGGRIELRGARRDEHVEISVTDTGVGIANEDQEAVFEEFRQVGDAVQRREGTGLGLALSRKFVELHGGRMWLASELGKGSTFTFTLPIHHVHHASRSADETPHSR
jgi:signal transduction histidine kinase/putative methionine-R-sulfoxide reductase with GAF domain